jgi:hypothetical protein
LGSHDRFFRSSSQANIHRFALRVNPWKEYAMKSPHQDRSAPAEE